MSNAPAPNRVSLLTPQGRGAVAVVAAAGPAAQRTLDAHLRLASPKPVGELPINRIAFGRWLSGEHREEVVLVRTSGDQWHVHCHGGIAASERIIAAMQAHGCRRLAWREWIGLATPDQFIVEADLALAKAVTRRTAAILLDQRHGALRNAFAEIEAAVAAGRYASARKLLDELSARAPLGRRLTEPWRVAIVGRPNVGKSSLLNALVGYQRAIVYDLPGTTRDVLTADTAVDGWPVRFIDAAGIRETQDPLEAEGVSRARQQLVAADLVLWVRDATALNHPEDDSLASELATLPPRKVLHVINKIDLAPHKSDNCDVAVSALTRDSLDRLLELISNRLVPVTFPAGVAVPFTERHQCALQALSACIPRPESGVSCD